MISRRLLPLVLFGVAFGIVAGGGNADARHRCRNGRASGAGWTTASYNSGYGYNGSTTTGYATSGAAGGYATPAAVGSVNGTSGPTYAGATQVNYPPATPINTGTQFNNGTQIQTQQRPIQQAPVGTNNGVIRNGTSLPAPDPSPDVDNSVDHRTTTAIPGANPAKAPAPAAAATAPR